MDKIKLYKFSLLLSIPVIFIGALFKIQHWALSSLIMSIGLLISLFYIVIGLIDVYENDNKMLPEKLMWVVGFLIIPMITGLIYYLRMTSKYNRIK
jgi:hypothetical protein